MRFATFTSLALTLAAAVSALPTAATEGLAVREAAVANTEANVNVYARETSDDIYARGAVDPSVLEARAKYKANKVDLTFPKTLQKGSIKQSDREEATDLAKRAMFQAEVKAGTVIYGWHDENTEDPVNHFTVEPTAGKGDGSGNGKIHVHQDGSWTQGPGGKISGNGDV